MATSERGRSSQNELYRLLDELDRLEELLEDMDELRVASRDDIETRMGEINAQIDQIEQSLPSSQ